VILAAPSWRRPNEGETEMKLLLKFNLVFAAVFLAGLALTGLVTRELLARNAQEEVLQHARFMMENALAVRSYTSTQVAPLLETQMKYTFLPQTVPAFSATEVLAKLPKNYSDYSYKEAVLNPTNPRNRAVDWEVDVVSQFRKSAEVKESIGERDTPAGRSLFIARPIRISDGACLRCHSTVDAAPRTLVDKYGPANGFGWNLHEVIGAQVVSVPMALPVQRAEHAWTVFMTLLTAVFLVIGIVLNGMLYWLVIRPVRQLSAIADRVSLGDLKAPQFKIGRRDEIGVLAESFSRMRRSLVQAMKMLES
jgi:HAMP domain-containing protein